jgi:hypothetical protein
MAMASRVSVPDTVMAPVYSVDAALGVVPFPVLPETARVILVVRVCRHA